MISYSSTDIRIFGAFCQTTKEVSSFSEITLPKIAAHAAMTRQSLYQTYYKSVDELIKAMQLYVDQDGQEKIKHFVSQKNKGFLKFFALEVLPLIYENRTFQAALYGDILYSGWIAYLENTYSPILEKYIQTDSSQLLEPRYTANLVLRQILAILSQWMRSPQPETPILFKDKFLYLMKLSPAELLNEEVL
ncbi:MAG: TetR/AcrR family transcriptional regulator [Streptococcaceae bacterium]|jgi:AcrR family transcriptional regulator|nr:TetR/AcrR family transcriptional regulator [Streptococcaceae bacterium]